MRQLHAVGISVIGILIGAAWSAAPARAESAPDGPTGALWTAQLEGCQRTPVVATPATGRASVELTFSTQDVLVSVSTVDGATAVTAIHLHGPAVRGADGPIVRSLPVDNPTSDRFTPTAETLDQLRAGQLYVDVHTVAFPDGELRGQLDDLGSACPPLVDAGAPDATDVDAGGLDAAMAVDGTPGSCGGCATHGGGPSAAAAAGVVAVLLGWRRRRRARPAT
ncbi:MAG: CHRD domain-containing protein [Kofleriaceae bacterium]